MLSPLEVFERELEKRVGRPTAVRPFVCDGSPLDCRAFIVGFNPATTMDTDFWEFWRSGYGFDKAAWFEVYKKERVRKPLKPGKLRRSPVSNTRRVIDWISDAASPCKCLETNVYSRATDSANELAQEHRNTAPFDFLLEFIKPAVIVTHGKDASHFVQTRWSSGTLICVSHFSRGWSRESARQLGAQIRDGCTAQQ